MNISLNRLFKREDSSGSNQPTNEPDKKEKSSANCPHHFGYLFKHSKEAPFEEKCLLCSRVVECIVHQ